jgi:hypothetical protein
MVNELLSTEVVGNLATEEKLEVEAIKTAVEKKLEIINTVEEGVADLVEDDAALPTLETVTSNDKTAVEALINSINEFENAYPGNLIDEQKEQLEAIVVSLEEKLDKIEELGTKIDEVEDDVESQPTYKDVTSEDKEDIKDVIENIDNILENSKDNLSEEEIAALEEQKKELEDMVEFIEMIEKYEPVSGDFENTTDVDENDKKGDLLNKSEELLAIIPLDKIEKEHVAKGEMVQVYLVVTDISEEVTEEDVELIDEVIGEKKVGAYLDLSLFKQIGERDPKKVPNTNGKVTITVEVPAELLAEHAAVPGTYQIVRVHEGVATIIDTVFDKETRMITFETDRFSTYALIFEPAKAESTTPDVPATPNVPATPDVPKVPETADTTNVMSILALLLFGCGMVVVEYKKKHAK